MLNDVLRSFLDVLEEGHQSHELNDFSSRLHGTTAIANNKVTTPHEGLSIVIKAGSCCSLEVTIGRGTV
jgi:hypothetical protein